MNFKNASPNILLPHLHPFNGFPTWSTHYFPLQPSLFNILLSVQYWLYFFQFSKYSKLIPAFKCVVFTLPEITPFTPNQFHSWITSYSSLRSWLKVTSSEKVSLNPYIRLGAILWIIYILSFLSYIAITINYLCNYVYLLLLDLSSISWL